ncbi:J domain-containing protein [Crocosphaera chwakensis]|uniref:DnaJ domain protein n=1 Tax=Crocosphaera chwakensis CCY0110 TaxID=391612 RepID=A3IP25_9CHRO|nr:DnaJ domain-containing protein [Crocosphaera chwakensis]EAZ91827.1 DnaJ domain protein [Crocosphaera chwakensis CCY0110]
MTQKNKQLNQIILDEIARITENNSVNGQVLEDFAFFVIYNHNKKLSKPTKTQQSKKIKPLTLSQLKKAVYQYFEVKDTTELKKSDAFKMAISVWDKLNLSKRESWEIIYRQFIGILPEEDGEIGKDCINGIHLFKYFRPYQVFGLEPKEASTQDIKKAYYRLSKIYHPDNQETGDARIFDRLTIMYKSITMEFK